MRRAQAHRCRERQQRTGLHTSRPTRATASLRALAAIALVAAGGLFWLTTFRWASQRPAAMPPMGSAAQCKACHPDVYAEWQRSQHSQAMTGVGVRTRMDLAPSPRDCLPCHAPQSVVMAKRTEDVKARAENRHSGVDCLSCHWRGDGVAAGRTVGDAPCRPVATPAVGTSAFCGLCHVSIFGDWQASPAAKQGHSCAHCHMPTVARKSRPGRSHLCFGGHDEDLVQSAVAMDADITPDRVLVRVRNLCPAHNMPGERHHRVLTLHYRRVGADGNIVDERRIEIKGVVPFKGESSSDKIKPGQTETYRFDPPAPGERFDAWLKYKLYPWQLDVSARSLSHVHSPD